VWRWVEVDPFGRRIYCAEDVWRAKVARRPELGRNEPAVRFALSAPDAIFFDQRSSAIRLAGGSSAAIMHYVTSGSVRLPSGDHPALVSVVVKLLDDEDRGETVGYVQTAYVTFRVLPRLQLVWGTPRNPGERNEADEGAGHGQD
jgi:hypothetical protein